MIKVRLNPDAATAAEAKEAVKQNDGYCPCKVGKTKDTKCMCKEFRTAVKNGETGLCECELYEAYKPPLGYLGGDIMSFGSQLARQYEYDEFLKRDIPVEVYSPVQNKSINDKSNMTEEQNNHLAEAITAADIERLWNSDFVVMCPEQSAIGSLCETGCLFGWKYMADKLSGLTNAQTKEEKLKQYDLLVNEIKRIGNKKDFFHYFDIRTNHLNEKDWRRSFSINQLLYGMILYASTNGDITTFTDIMNSLEKIYKPIENGGQVGEE